MNYFNYYLDAWKKYAVFTGRARRREFWYFFLFHIIALIILNVIEHSIKTGFLTVIYSLAVLVPCLAIGARRLHDTHRSGWWQLLWFIPVIGTIILIIFLAQDSKPGTNKYGPNPKEMAQVSI